MLDKEDLIEKLENKEKQKNVKKQERQKISIKNILVRVFVGIIIITIVACIANVIYIQNQDKYIFLCTITDAKEDTVHITRDDSDDFDLPINRLCFIKGHIKNLLDKDNQVVIVTQFGGLITGHVSGNHLHKIDKITIEDFYKYTNLYVDSKNKVYLAMDSGENIFISKDGIKENKELDDKLVLRAENISLFDNDVKSKKQLVSFTGTNSKKEKVEFKAPVNSLGNLVGIDVNRGETYKLEEILISNNIINNTTTIEGTNYDTSSVAGKIGFVYIKIGSSSYSNENKFQTVENYIYKPYSEICEKYGIPYGFYYYSTSVTPAEADIEFETITSRIDSLNSAKYNVLPICIDVELADDFEKDRQYGKNVTNTKTHLANMLYKAYGKTVLYTSGKAASSLSEKRIIDLAEYYNLIDGKLNLWTPAPKLPNGNMGPITTKYYEELLGRSDTLFEQTHLDIEDKNAFDYDLDLMSKKVFTDLIK